MGQQKEVDLSLANECAPLTGLRNVLAHEYDSIDNDQLFEAAIITVKLVPQYLKLVVKIS